VKPLWGSALGRSKVVEDSARNLAQRLDKPVHDTGAVLRSGHSDHPSNRFGRSASEPWNVKWCRCRFKVFALEYEGRHYCRCGYPIKRYAIYDMSPPMQALWPIGVILGIIGLVYVVSAPLMHWDNKSADCDNIVLACPDNGKPPTCDDIVVACSKGG
jgi:hypothetical protein